MNKLNHIALIPDGNRRFAKKHKYSPWKGHENGKKTIEKLILHWIKSEISYFTIYSLSIENLKKRSEIEKKFLYKILMNSILSRLI